MYKQAGMYVRKTKVEDIVFNIYFTDLTLPWIILLPGLPQYMHKQWYLKEIIRSRCVLNPYYPGSFHSDGRFNTASLKRVVDDSLDLLGSGKFYDFFEDKIYSHNGVLDSVWGLSFGSNILFDYMIEDNKRLIKPVLFGPLLQMSNPGQSNYFKQKLAFLGTDVYKNIYRGYNPKEVFEWIRGMENKNIQTIYKDGVVLFGKNDKLIDRDFLKGKFPTFEIREVDGFEHEIDNLVGRYITENYAKQ